MSVFLNKSFVSAYAFSTLAAAVCRYQLGKADNLTQHIFKRTLPSLAFFAAVNSNFLKGRLKLLVVITSFQLGLTELVTKIFTPNSIGSEQASKTGATDPAGLPHQKESFKPQVNVSIVPDARSTAPGKVSSILDSPSVGAMSLIGGRSYQEDFYTASSIQVENYPEAKLFLVFDGHGAPHVSKKACDQVSNYMSKYLAKYIAGKATYTKADVLNAIKAAFADLRTDFSSKSYSVYGTTCTGALCFDGAIWPVNIGDSRTIFIPNTGDVVSMTDDAKPLKERSVAHAKKYGGTVGYEERVFDPSNTLGLLTSGAIGDSLLGEALFRRPKVTYFSASDLTSGYLMIASDGAFDNVSSETYNTLIQSAHSKGATLKTIVDTLTTSAVQENGKRSDNTTIMLHALTPEFLGSSSGKMVEEETERSILLVNAPEEVKELVKSHNIQSYSDLKAKEENKELTKEQAASIRAYRAYSLDEALASLAKQREFLKETPVDQPAKNQAAFIESTNKKF
jgi:serine/threonine protein phosphatase PrpC